ncbi:hypothetical protein BDF19DRAFT_438754 [Syncephalis fuscata]|nr:hypothetical protein BDF19DRAFT_438754 [Syncephalis fuscata]
MDSTKGLMSNGTHQNLSAGHGESGVQCWSERDLERVMEKQMAQIQAQREKEAARRVRQQADEARRERLLNQWKSMVNDKLSSPPPPPSSSLSALPPRSMLIAKNNQSSSGRHRNSRMANLPLEQPDHRLASPEIINFNAIQNGAQPTGRHGRPWASMPIEPQPLPPFNNGQPNYIRHQTLGVSRRNSGSTHSGNSNGRGRIHRWLSESYVVATPSDVSPSPPVSFQQMPMSQQHHLQFRDGWSINSGDIPENTSTASPQLPLAQLSFNQQHPAYPSNIPLGYHNATNPTSSLMQSQLNSGHYYMNNAYNMSTHYNHAGPNGYLPSNGQPMRYTPGYPTIDTSKPWNSANYSHALNRHSSSGYGLRNRSTSSKKSITSDNDDNQPLTNGLLMRLPKQHPMSGRSSSSGNGQPLISSMYVPPASSAAAVPFNTQQYQQPTMSANRSNTMLSGYPLTSNGHRFSGTLLNEHNSLLLSSSPQQPQISNCSYEQPNYYGHNNSHNPQLGKQDPNKTISTIVGSEEEAMAAWTSVGAPPACINGWRGIASMRQQRQQQQQQQQQRCSLPSAQAMLTNTTVSSSITTATTVTAMANKPTNTAHPVYPDSVENSEDGSVSSSSSSSETSSSDSFSSSTQSLH